MSPPPSPRPPAPEAAPPRRRAASGLGACGMLELPRVASARGSLAFAEACRHLPFPLRRVYWIYDVPAGGRRGAHAHRRLEQVVVALSGSFEVVLSDDSASRRFRLTSAHQGLYLAPMVWRDLLGFSSGAVALVLASLPYDEADYVRDRGEYLRLLAAS